MITDNKSTYQEAKNRVLSVYESFLEMMDNELIKEIINPFQNVLESLENEIERVKEDKFNLMVAGEAKCGKSTFINAYLGVDILPMDVMQCTSSIIEIKYGEELLLEVEYADGTKQQIKGEETIRQFLKENAAIDGNYRSIPVPIINTELLIKSQGNPLKKDVEYLIEKVQDANIHNLPKKEYAKKIFEYINLRKKSWEKLVVKLVVKYPFESDELRGIEIIDSPGVNAAGKIGDSTEQYIKNADAIMFLKPLSGAAVESLEFKYFLEKSSKEKSKNTLFLILTRAADSKEDEIQILVNQACKVFNNISSDKVLPVDSKIQMYKQKVKNMSSEEVQNWIAEGLNNQTIDNFIAGPWLTSGMNVKKFLEKLEAIARFEPLKQSIDEFGRKAHYLRFTKIFNEMLMLIEKTSEIIVEQREMYEEKRINPNSLEEKINNILDTLKEIENKMKKDIKVIKIEYGGRRGIITSRLNEVKTEFSIALEMFDSNEIDDFQQLTQNYVDMYSRFVERIQRELVNRCNRLLEDLSVNINISKKLLEIFISEDEFKKIEEFAKNDASEEVLKRKCFKKVKVPFFNRKRYTDALKEYIKGHADKIFDDIDDSLQIFKDQVLIECEKKLIEQSRAYEERLTRINNEKAENEILAKKIECYNILLNQILHIKDLMKSEVQNVDIDN